MTKTTKDQHTCKRDVEAFIGDGEVGDEPELGSEVSKQTSLNGVWQDWPSEPGYWLWETPILRDQQIVVGTFKMEGVEIHLHSWEMRAGQSI